MLRSVLLLIVSFNCLLCVSQSEMMYNSKLSKVSACIKEGKHNEAEQLIFGLLENYPDSAECYLQLGENYYFMDEFGAALVSLNESLRLDSSKLEAIKYRGVVYHRRSELDKAQRDYDKYLQSFPKDNFIYLKRVELYFETKQLQKCKSDLKKYLIDYPADSWAWNKLAFVFVEEKNWNVAIEMFSEGIKVDSLNSDTYINRARAYGFNNNRVASCEDVLTAINLGAIEYGADFYNMNCFYVLKMNEPDTKYHYPEPPIDEVIIERK